MGLIACRQLLYQMQQDYQCGFLQNCALALSGEGLHNGECSRRNSAMRLLSLNTCACGEILMCIDKLCTGYA